MGLLDQLVGQVMGKLGAQKQDTAPQQQLLGSVMGLIGGTGGLPALLQKLQDNGLQDQVTSWIGTGENQPVSGDQIESALGEDTVQEVAQQAGIAPEHAASGLAQLLPQIVDKLTPNGEIPQGDMMQKGMELLKGKFFH